MNKTFRTVWNATRQCFMVASERTRTRGKAGGSLEVRAVVEAVAAALMVLAEWDAPAQAADCTSLSVSGAIVSTGSGAVTVTIPEGASISSACILGAHMHLSVSPTGALLVTNTAASLFAQVFLRDCAVLIELLDLRDVLLADFFELVNVRLGKFVFVDC